MSFNPQAEALDEVEKAEEQLRAVDDYMGRMTLGVTDRLIRSLVHAILAVAYSNMKE